MIDEPYRLVEAISNRREYIENELARIFPELPAILAAILAYFASSSLYSSGNSR